MLNRYAERSWQEFEYVKRFGNSDRLAKWLDCKMDRAVNVHPTLMSKLLRSPLGSKFRERVFPKLLRMVS